MTESTTAPVSKTAPAATHVTAPTDIRLTRQRAGLSLRSVAAMAGITAPYLYDLEMGRRHLHEGRRRAILGVIRRGRVVGKGKGGRKQEALRAFRELRRKERDEL